MRKINIERGVVVGGERKRDQLIIYWSFILETSLEFVLIPEE
jgi:hypothetical protein